MTSFSKHIGKFGLIALFLFLIQSCETPEKVLKSNDLDYKIKTATAWYNKKQYVKCIPVFEELMGLLKGTKSTEDIYYMYCMSNFRQGDYLIAAYHFNNFGKLYPNSPKAEECSYMAARSHQKLSPKYQLDQTNTYKAIETYQTFVNLYPESNRVDSANIEFQKLKKKLEFKAVKNAELYYKTENFKAAATSFKNLLVDYPDVDNPDYVYFMIIKSYDKYAGNSVAYKKAERYRDVAKSYDEFVYRFPKSKYIAQGKKIAEDSHFNTVMGASELMNTVRLDEKPREYPKAIREIETQIPLIANEKQKKKAQQILEKTYLQWMKNDVLLAEEAKPEQKINLYEQSIKNYYTFVDKYKASNYAKAAEKNFLQASDKLKNLKKMDKSRRIKLSQLLNTIETQNMKDIGARTGNVYESLAIIAKRANQIHADLKQELHSKLEDFASHSDSLEEIHENREQIEISRFYERLPHPTIISTNEFLESGLEARYND